MESPDTPGWFSVMSHLRSSKRASSPRGAAPRATSPAPRKGRLYAPNALGNFEFEVTLSYRSSYSNARRSTGPRPGPAPQRPAMRPTRPQPRYLRRLGAITGLSVPVIGCRPNWCSARRPVRAHFPVRRLIDKTPAQTSSSMRTRQSASRNPRAAAMSVAHNAVPRTGKGNAQPSGSE
jgi:hypothetical protein